MFKKKAINIPTKILNTELKIKFKFICIKKFLITSSQEIENIPMSV